MEKTINKKGVFGLTSVQAFFAIILAVGLLAYVIVIIMGSLSANTNTLIPLNSNSITNETLSNFTVAGVAVANNGAQGFTNFVVTLVSNATGGGIIPATNYTVSGDGLVKAIASSPFLNEQVNVSYSYQYFAQAGANANNILSNTSIGISSFFGSINPVYAILAILVIILVLVVLVRVVSGGEGQTTSSPQL